MKRIFGDSNRRNLTPSQDLQRAQQQNNTTNNEHYPITLPPLTDDLYAYLVDPLSKQDFERAMRIAGVKNLSELLQLTDTYKRTLLIFAGMSGNTELIKILLSSASNPDALASMKDANGMTALMHAIKRRKPEPIKALLDNVKNPEQLIFMTNDKNKAALRLAIEQNFISDLYGDYEIIIHHHTEMLEQENKYQAELIKTLFSYVSDKNALIRGQSVDSREMLNYALRFDNAELLKIFLDSVDNPEELLTMQDSEGKNLLMYAASQGKAKSIEVILRSVKNPEAFVMMKDAEDRTALMLAISHNHLESIKAILSNVGNADQLAFMKNKDHYNALMLAAVCGDYYTITTLLDHVKNPIELIYSSMHDGTTALMLAAKDDYLDNSEDNVITAILERAKKVRDPNYRFSPTYSKGKNSYIPLNLDSLIFMKNSKGMNAFMAAIKNGIPQAILPFLILATDKLGLFDKNNNDQKNVLDFIDEKLCNELISELGSKKISMELQDIDGVLSLLKNHRASYSRMN